LLKADSSTNYALSPEVLSEAISNDIAGGLVPFFLCATVRIEHLHEFVRNCCIMHGLN